MTCRVVPLTPGAALPLSLMHAVCFPEEPWDEAVLRDLLALFGVFGYAAWRRQAPAGFVLARDLGEEAEILSLGVVPQCRRRGIGRMLLDAALAEAAHRRLASVVLEVAEANDPARRLYAAAGFVRVGRRPSYYRRDGQGEDALIFRCPMNGRSAGQ